MPFLIQFMVKFKSLMELIPFCDSDRTVIVFGLDQLVVIDAPDVTMITTLDKSEQLKDLLAILDPAISSKINETCRIDRPSGWYERIA